MRSYWIRVGPVNNEHVLIREKKDTQRDLGNKPMERLKQRLELPKNHQELSEAGGGKKGFFPQALEGDMAMLMLDFHLLAS
jgi:hypothetical protein